MAKTKAEKAPKHKGSHKVRLIKYPSGYKEFFCTLPDCPYRVRAELFIGKRALCNDCGKEFEITSYHMRRTLPKCIECVCSKVSTRQYVSRASTLELPAPTSLPMRLIERERKKDPVEEISEALHSVIYDFTSSSNELPDDTDDDGDI